VIAAAIAAGARIEVVPGPSAVLAGLVGSGLPSERFTFLGFPPREAGARRALFGTLRDETATMIFYEAPDRVAATLDDLAAAFGADRRARPRPRADQAARGARARHAAGACREVRCRATARRMHARRRRRRAAAPPIDIEAEVAAARLGARPEGHRRAPS